MRRKFSVNRAALAGSRYIGGLGPFLSLDDLELNGVTFCEAFIPVGCDGTVVNKHIRSSIVAYKPKPFGIVKPLDCPF